MTKYKPKKPRIALCDSLTFQWLSLTHWRLSLLLYGEPGTGKTYFGKMLADLANAHFFYAYAFPDSLGNRSSPMSSGTPRGTI
jgi:SpoVK/Ycf46/Vps4 family AAA+-type ATPase